MLPDVEGDGCRRLPFCKALRALDSRELAVSISARETELKEENNVKRNNYNIIIAVIIITNYNLNNMRQ